ncbi:MAG: hypothetical protein A2Y33_04905 [Spirochaetes bacterium GWF1_51_8]|nr:MAG: hypothetical protein A2Y33_04905 [Spirochaetes bacterium GWF1_51_8]
MSFRKLLMSIALLGVGIGLVSGSMDSAYKNLEIKEKKGTTMYVAFRINIPYAIQYVENQLNGFKKKLETAEKGKKALQVKITNYSVTLNLMKKNKIKRICVFGDFNGWMTFASEKPNVLKPGTANPDTWYTPNAVPFLVSGAGEKLRYKFVLDIGKTYIAADGKEQEFIYLEDPKNTSKSDDGFGGFNSEFLSK